VNHGWTTGIMAPGSAAHAAHAARPLLMSGNAQGVAACIDSDPQELNA